MKKIFLVCLLLLAMLTGCVVNPNIPRENIEPIDINAINDKDRLYINFAMALHMVRFEMDGIPTEEQKGLFFSYLISTDILEERVAQWYNEADDIYTIPLSEIEEILFTYLAVDSLDPIEAFGGVYPGYDEEKEALLLSMIGGFGGARAHGVLDIKHEGDELTVKIGSFDMEKFFYSEPREYDLLETYTVDFLLDSENQNVFQIQRALRQ